MLYVGKEHLALGLENLCRSTHHKNCTLNMMPHLRSIDRVLPKQKQGLVQPRSLQLSARLPFFTHSKPHKDIEK